MSRDSPTPLCCCEYVNEQQEPSHLLATCCNCPDLDQSFDRLIGCQRVPHSNISAMKTTFQDRLRIPWRGGAKQISLDSALPIILLPIAFYIASESFTCTVVVFIGIQIGVLYSHLRLGKFLHKTKLCYVWSVTSLVMLLMVFELRVVPLMELLPEENLILAVLVGSSIYCGFKVRANAPLNIVDAIVGSDVYDWSECSTCEKQIPPRASHCQHCQSCIAKKDHHCFWLDCCIGEKNHLFYVLTVFFCLGSLIYGAILTLTSVCHPFFFLNLVLVPDDCSDVYHDFDIALCFVGGVYALQLAAGMLMTLIQQFWLVSLGVTGQEWRKMSRRWLGIAAPRNHSKGFCRNWYSFFFQVQREL